MTLRSMVGSVRRTVLCSFQRRMIPLGDHGPMVSFTFDDFPRSALLAAGRILEDFGGRGTYYTAAGLMEKSNGLGELCNLDDLRAVLERGHELGTQTYEHSSCRKLSTREFERDVQHGIDEVERLTGYHADNFAYPYGHVTLGTKRALQNLSSIRSIFPGVNGPEIDLNLLRANRLYGDVEGNRAVQKLISDNLQQKSWLIFYTHDVRPNPSEYGCTPEVFEFAVSAAAKSGTRILTVGKALSELGIVAQGCRGCVPPGGTGGRP